MSKVAIQGAATGTGVFTLASPATNTDRTLTLPDEAGTVLTSAGVPASAMPAGSVLQVVSFTKTDTTSGTNRMSENSWVTALSVSITPTNATSKILVIANVNLGGLSVSGDSAIVMRMARGSTAICVGDAIGNRRQTSAGPDWPARSDMQLNYGVSFLDTPNTTSSTTYNIQPAIRGVGTGTWYLNRSVDWSGNNTTEFATNASTITVMEIAA